MHAQNFQWVCLAMKASSAEQGMQFWSTWLHIRELRTRLCQSAQLPINMDGATERALTWLLDQCLSRAAKDAACSHQVAVRRGL